MISVIGSVIEYDSGADKRHWELTQRAVSAGGQVSLRGLPPLVVIEVLFIPQQRTRSGHKLTDTTLRAVCDTLRREQATSIGACEPDRVPGKPPVRCCGRWPARRAGPWPIPSPSRSRTPGTWACSVILGG